MSDLDIFGAVGLATRFAWLGAIASALLWLNSIRTIWRVEGSRHHLVARVLSSLTMILMDVIIIVFFWPRDYLEQIVVLDAQQARALVAFVVGTQLVAGIYQITAPKQGRVRRDGQRTR